MKKVALVLSVVALACGGAGFALGAATFARADDEVPAHTVVRTVATTTVERVQPIAPQVAETVAREPRVAPEPAPRRPAVVDVSSDVRVRRLVVTSAIADHEPADTIGTMTAGEHARVYAFVELANRGGAGQLVVTFEREGGPVTGHVELDAPANVGRWRTWAYSRGVDRAGEWSAVVRDEDGTELARQAFVVE